MAIDSPYAIASEYRTVTGRTDTGADAQILLDLTAVSRYLEGRLERFFNNDLAVVQRTYIPTVTSDTLRVDDLAFAPTIIALDTEGDGTYASTLAATDYELLPVNAAVGPEPRPWTQIRILPWSDDYSTFTKDERVRLTARWGWPAVPGAIKQATIHLTAILRLETPRATNRVVELGDAIEASPEAQHIIRQLTDNYRRITYV